MAKFLVNGENIERLKKRAQTQFNWANTTVLSLIDKIEQQEQEKDELKGLLGLCDPREEQDGILICQFCKAGPGEQHKEDCNYLIAMKK